MARLQTNYYHSYSKGLDTSSGMRNVAPSSNLQQAYQDQQDAAKYRELVNKTQVVDGNRYNPSLIPENADYTDKKWKESATFQDQRIINNAAEAETRRRRMNDISNSNEWYAKQWDNEMTNRRNSGISGGSAGDEIYYAQVTESMRKSPYGGNHVDSQWATDAYNRRMADKHYDTDAQLQNNEANRKHEMHLESFKARQTRENNMLSMQDNAADRASKERIAKSQAEANIYSTIYSRPYNWQYW